MRQPPRKLGQVNNEPRPGVVAERPPQPHDKAGVAAADDRGQAENLVGEDARGDAQLLAALDDYVALDQRRHDLQKIRPANACDGGDRVEELVASRGGQRRSAATAARTLRTSGRDQPGTSPAVTSAYARSSSRTPDRVRAARR